MTDLRRHSRGFWRSIYIFKELKEQSAVAVEIDSKLVKMGIDDYSYCHYGKVLSSDDSFAEQEHITFRVNFPSLEEYEEFKQWISKKKWTWEDHNYDEPLWVKEAYVVGTKLAKELIRLNLEPDIQINANFLRLMLHGCFNDLGWSKGDEAELYHFLWDTMLYLLTGIAKKKESDGKKFG